MFSRTTQIILLTIYWDLTWDQFPYYFSEKSLHNCYNDQSQKKKIVSIVVQHTSYDFQYLPRSSTMKTSKQSVEANIPISGRISIQYATRGPNLRKKNHGLGRLWGKVACGGGREDSACDSDKRKVNNPSWQGGEGMGGGGRQKERRAWFLWARRTRIGIFSFFWGSTGQHEKEMLERVKATLRGSSFFEREGKRSSARSPWE